ncbi:hypothetical protein PVAP13_9KG547500 [Panicum virgatum]|uniref:Uncharacterized protein n=1 Tax=Panicum virgatum TaxID=38727 RepID=A0A8T0P2B7_PANVG|nr:hypothetical protein PVAP13_9KG547500 [Panicum virgatum]
MREENQSGPYPPAVHPRGHASPARKSRRGTAQCPPTAPTRPSCLPSPSPPHACSHPRRAAARDPTPAACAWPCSLPPSSPLPTTPPPPHAERRPCPHHAERRPSPPPRCRRRPPPPRLSGAVGTPLLRPAAVGAPSVGPLLASSLVPWGSLPLAFPYRASPGSPSPHPACHREAEDHRAQTWKGNSAATDGIDQVRHWEHLANITASMLRGPTEIHEGQLRCAGALRPLGLLVHDTAASGRRLQEREHEDITTRIGQWRVQLRSVRRGVLRRQTQWYSIAACRSRWTTDEWASLRPHWQCS